MTDQERLDRIDELRAEIEHLMAGKTPKKTEK